jgi:hypothetical protein
MFRSAVRTFRGGVFAVFLRSRAALRVRNRRPEIPASVHAYIGNLPAILPFRSPASTGPESRGTASLCLFRHGFHTVWKTVER